MSFSAPTSRAQRSRRFLPWLLYLYALVLFAMHFVRIFDNSFVGTGQGRLTNGFIFLYKPIHAASFFPLPYVTLRNSPQLTGNLV